VMYGSRIAVLDPIPGNPLPGLSEPDLHRFYAYLEEKRGAREFAARRDIDPLDFPYVLGNIVLFDVLYQPLRFRYRLVGSMIVARVGYDMTGKFLHEHPHPSYRDYMLECYAEVIRSRRPSGGDYDLFMDREIRRYRCIRVPLSNDGEIIDKIISAAIPRPVAAAR
jgi:PAS domain